MTDRLQNLSAVVVSFNEEDKIADCLRSLRFAGEVLVVDTGSTDDTPIIAKRLADRFVRLPWLGYGPTKRLAAHAAVNDWVLFIDADERVTPELEAEIRDLWQTPVIMSIAGCRIPIKAFLAGVWVRHSGWYPSEKIRLFNRNQGNWNKADIHEKVVLKGRVPTLESNIVHYTAISFGEFWNKQNRYVRIMSREIAKHRAPKPLKGVSRGIKSFFSVLIGRQGWRDGFRGFLIATASLRYFIASEFKARIYLRNKPLPVFIVCGATDPGAVQQIAFANATVLQKELFLSRFVLRNNNRISEKLHRLINSGISIDQFRGNGVVYAFKRICHAMLRSPYSIWHIHTCHLRDPSRSIAGLLALLGQTYVLHEHLPTATSGGRLSPLEQYFLRWTMRKANAVIAVSPSNRRFITRHWKVPQYKVRVVPNCVAIEWENDKTDWLSRLKPELWTLPRLLVVGSMESHRKGHLQALRIMKNISIHYPQATMIMAGDGMLRNSFQAYAKELKISHAVRWIGFVEPIYPLYRYVDVMVHPSADESFGLAIAEAMAFRVPVVAKCVGGIKDLVIHGETGWCVGEDDVQAMTSAVLDVLEHPEKTRDITSAAQRRIQEYYSTKMFESRLRRFYKEIAEVPLINGST